LVRCSPISVPNTASPANARQSTTNAVLGSQGPVPTENAGTAVTSADSGVIYVPCVPGRQVPGESFSIAPDERVPLGNRETAEMHQDTAATQRTATNLTADLRRYAPEINWDYAIVQRVNPTDLTSKLIWM